MTTLRAYLRSVRLSILCAGYREYSTDAVHLIQWRDVWWVHSRSPNKIKQTAL